MPATTKIEVNGATFDSDKGFPKTGFVGAKFQFAMNGDTANNSRYTWSVKRGAWLTVDGSGNVTFNSEGDGQASTLATPVAGGTPLEYTIDVDTWFINNGATSFVVDTNADAWCAAQSGGYTVPSYTQMTNSTVMSSSTAANEMNAPHSLSSELNDG